MPSQNTSGPTYQVRALQRGLSVLRAFTSSRTDLTLQELHDDLRLNKATLLRLLDVLIQMGFLEQDATTARYRLGIRAFELGSAYSGQASLERVALPELRELSARTGQTANLGICDGHEVVHVAAVEPDRPVRFHIRVGARDALHCTGLGKILAAFMTPRELKDYLREADLGARTPHTITTRQRLLAELEQVRRDGYAEDREETSIGLRCLAVPVRNVDGHVVAALSISGPAAEFLNDTQGALGQALTRAANRISEQLGYDGQTLVTNQSRAPLAR